MGHVGTRKGKKDSNVISLSKVAEQAAEYQALTPQQLEKQISQLESEMYQHAQNLEFEQAAQKRDEIEKLRAQFIVNS